MLRLWPISINRLEIICGHIYHRPPISISSSPSESINGTQFREFHRQHTHTHTHTHGRLDSNGGEEKAVCEWQENTRAIAGNNNLSNLCDSNSITNYVLLATGIVCLQTRSIDCNHVKYWWWTSFSSFVHRLLSYRRKSKAICWECQATDRPAIRRLIASRFPRRNNSANRLSFHGARHVSKRSN